MNDLITAHEARREQYEDELYKRQGVMRDGLYYRSEREVIAIHRVLAGPKKGEFHFYERGLVEHQPYPRQLRRVEDASEHTHATAGLIVQALLELESPLAIGTSRASELLRESLDVLCAGYEP